MRHYSNTAVQTALLAGVTAADPSLTVVDANGYPATPFAIVVDPGDALQEEVMLVTAAAGAAWTVTRGYDGATAKAHAAGATVIHAAIAADFADLYDGLATKEDALGNPASDGYVLSSTAAGARSWIAPGGGGGSPFIASSDSAVPLIARGHSPTQTGDLEQWQASDSGVLAAIHANGGLALAPIFMTASDDALNIFFTAIPISSGGFLNGINIYGYSGASSATIRGMSGISGGVEHYGANPISGSLYGLSGLEFYAYAAGDGNVIAVNGVAIDFGGYGAGAIEDARGVWIRRGDATAPTTNLYGLRIEKQSGATNNYAIWTDGGETRHKTGAAATVGLSIQRAASQSADLFRLLDSDGSSILHRINKDGYAVISRNSAPADGDIAAGDVVLWFDKTNGAAKLKIKAKQADGTVVAGEVALA